MIEKILQLENIVILLIIALVILMIIATISSVKKSFKNEKRITSFSLLPINDNQYSILDTISKIMWAIVNGISYLLNKIGFKKYGSRYEKYISYNEENIKNGTDYITIKILFALLLSILCIIITLANLNTINIIAILISFFAGFFIVDIYLNIKFIQKKKRIEEDLIKAITIMNNAFKAGKSTIQAIDLVKNEFNGPIADEFKKIHRDITYGLNFELAFKRFYQRVNLDDARYIATSLALLNKTGGNIVKIFSSIERNFINRKKMQNELKSLTAASVFVYRFLLAMPFIFALSIILLNPNYFKPLFNTIPGGIILILVAILYSLYIIIIRKNMKVDI